MTYYINGIEYYYYKGTYYQCMTISAIHYSLRGCKSVYFCHLY